MAFVTRLGIVLSGMLSVSSEAKVAWESAKKRRCLSHEGSESTRQRHVLAAKAVEHTRQRRCLSREDSGTRRAKAVS